MRVRSASEVQSLDDDLNLFEESDWDFMAVVDTHSQNYEYFNDIRDEDFDVRKRKFKEYIPYILSFASLLIVAAVVVLRVTNFFDDSEWRELNGIQSVAGGTGVVQYVDGTEASAEELIEVSNSLAGYVSYLQAKGDYNGMDAYVDGGSSFADKYYDCTNSVQTIYDVNDCFARGLREFASYYKVQRINRVIKKGDIYYCYATVQYSSIYDVSEFVNMHNQSFTMKFQGGTNISEAPVAKFLLEVVAENPVPLSLNEVCIQMKQVNGNFVLTDDDFILTMASDDYTVAVNQLLKLLGGVLTN